MSIVVGVSTDGVRLPLPRARVIDAARSVLRAEKVGAAMLSITFVSTTVIRRLNRRHLGRAGATDVIAFGFRRTGRHAPVVGDVYIAAEVARAAARANRVPVREEMLRLVVHGILHVLGHDHPETDARMRSPMWRKQERIVNRLASSRR